MINRVPLVSICKDVNHASCDRVSKMLAMVAGGENGTFTGWGRGWGWDGDGGGLEVI